jgi:hypothetical protein
MTSTQWFQTRFSAARFIPPSFEALGGLAVYDFANPRDKRVVARNTIRTKAAWVKRLMTERLLPGESCDVRIEREGFAACVEVVSPRAEQHVLFIKRHVFGWFGDPKINRVGNRVQAYFVTAP